MAILKLRAVGNSVVAREVMRRRRAVLRELAK